MNPSAHSEPNLIPLKSTETKELNSIQTQQEHAPRASLVSGSTLAAGPIHSGTSTTEISSKRLKPIIVYRGDNGRIRACVIPRACSPEQGNQVTPRAGSPAFYFPQEYRHFKKILTECTGYYPRFQFYRGENPSNETTWYNVDVLGRSCTSGWYSHFPHFIYHFARKVMVAASLFLSEGNATLPHPQCLYPANNASFSSLCRKGEIELLKPRILISNSVMKRAWTRRFMQLLTRGMGTEPRSVQSLLLKTDWNGRGQRTECFQSLITTPEHFDIDLPGHDSLLRTAGIERSRKCNRKPHIVLLSRWYAPGYYGRKILNSTMNELQSEISKASNASVEWIYGLGRLDFSEQIRLMQRTDVLVTAHGAELSSALFLRRGARVFELMPFGGHTWYFNYSVMAPIHVKFIPYATNPDPDRFYNCIEKRKGSVENKALLIKARTMYEQHYKFYGEAKNETQRQKVGLFHVGHGWMQICVKHQVSDFNPNALARLVSREASARCNHGQ